MNTFYEAFTDEMSKIALSRAAAAALVGLGTSAGTATGLAIGMGKKGRKKVLEEIHDPRLYSNLRGMATLESKEKRVAAHKDLPKGKHSVLGAMRAGLTRKKEKK